MKRLALVTGLALLLVGASQALASTDAGVTSGGAKKVQSFAISFKVAKKDGKPTSVKHFNYGQDCHDPDVGPKCVGDDNNNANNVPMTCDGPTNVSTFLNGYLPTMKVKQGAFKGKFTLNTDSNPSDPPEAEVDVAGEFKNHNQKVVGTLRIFGDFGNGPQYSNCDSTKLDWSAT